MTNTNSMSIEITPTCLRVEGQAACDFITRRLREKEEERREMRSRCADIEEKVGLGTASAWMECETGKGIGTMMDDLDCIRQINDLMTGFEG